MTNTPTAIAAATVSPRVMRIESLLHGGLIGGVFLLWLGGLGGSLQPSRLVLVAMLALIVFVSRAVVLVRGAYPVYAAYALIFALGVLTIPLSTDVRGGLSLMSTMVLGMTSILLVRTRISWRGARQVRDAWSAALLCTLPFAVYEITSGNHFVYALEQRNVGGEIGALPFASVFFGNHNNYSTFICLSYPMLLGTLLDTSSTPRRAMLLLGSALSLAITLINTSRIATLFVLVASIVIVATAYRGSILGLVALVGIAGAAVWASGFNLQYAQLRFAVDLVRDQSASERFDLTLAGAQALGDSFGLGLGPGGFVPYVTKKYPGLIENPHNLLLELAVNFSLYASIAFMAVLGLLFVRLVRRPDVPPGLRLPVLITLPFVPIIGSLNSLAVGYTYWWYWMATAVLVSVSRPCKLSTRDG
jgi:hypothetical protein